MKKLFAILLCLCVLLAGCVTVPPAADPSSIPTTQPATQPTETTEPSTEPMETEPLTFDLPMSAMVLTEQVELTQDDSTETLFTYSYQNIRLYLPDDAVSETVTLELLNRIDATRTKAQSTMQNGGTGYSIVYTPRRIDSGILSLSGVARSFSGGQPMTVCTGVTYDLLTGRVLTLTDILTAQTGPETLCTLVVDALSALEADAHLYSDFAVTVENRFSQNLENDEAWYLSNEGLCFDFAPYEVAPNSAGIVTAMIPYEALLGVLEDAWFPVEQVSAPGSLSAMDFADWDPVSIQHMAEVVLDPEGVKLLLTAEGLLYNVTLETGSWNGNAFTPEETVFYADHMTRNHAILVQTQIPDTMPTVRITYTTDSGTTQVFLSQSGEDGSPILITE